MPPAIPGIENETGARSVVAPNAEQVGDGVSLLELWIVVAQHKKWIGKVTAAIMVLAAIVTFLLPNHYTATTTLLPPQQNQSLAAALSGQLSGMGPLAAVAGKDLGLKTSSDLYIGML